MFFPLSVAKTQHQNATNSQIEQIGGLSRRFRSNKASADHVLRARSKHGRVL